MTSQTLSSKQLSIPHYLSKAVVRIQQDASSLCSADPALWNEVVVCVTACDASLNNFTCEHCLVARNLIGDPLCSVKPTAIAPETRTGRPTSTLPSNCRSSEEAVETKADQASKKRRMQLEQSPPRDAQQELALRDTQAAYQGLADTCEALAGAPPSRRVVIQRSGKDPLNLCEAASAILLFKKLRVGMQQARILTAWNWETTFRSLKMVPLLRAYRGHPIAEVGGQRSSKISAHVV
jgi:hypothetical protein